MLEIRDLTVRYGGILALDKISITVPKEETVILVGANGAGKSSLINAIIGMVPTAGGSMTFEGVDLAKVAPSMRAGHGIGYSPEGRRVFPTMTVRDNVLAGASRIGRAAQADVYDKLATLFPMLRDKSDDLAGYLSGGQQQMVAIARAMSASPKLLLLDEPFLGLAPVWIQQISDAIRQFSKSGVTVLMTEQMAVPALKVATRGYVMRGGAILREGPVAELRSAALAEEYL
ncbi:ABC transporter ATP-binding protein [Enterovirga rhinocerotis]|uniref:Branched-chain amino acid transport system ATP-binding protein n=1 Tax=Enterovirga rhinocerotis TaxID=1339210 RepID=A0A4R7C5G2_9HYPH|nr:ABC transporter ATP-binding protein [Enterovirga rhinocerotis]TDR93303.1 branched-chain amino acid transport system ATP-binding protein [Enterovirga rhinocerotis]